MYVFKQAFVAGGVAAMLNQVERESIGISYYAQTRQDREMENIDKGAPPSPRGIRVFNPKVATELLHCCPLCLNT
jgi:hypothetical protein